MQISHECDDIKTKYPIGNRRLCHVCHVVKWIKNKCTPKRIQFFSKGKCESRRGLLFTLVLNLNLNLMKCHRKSWECIFFPNPLQLGLPSGHPRYPQLFELAMRLFYGSWLSHTKSSLSLPKDQKCILWNSNLVPPSQAQRVLLTELHPLNSSEDVYYKKYASLL